MIFIFSWIYSCFIPYLKDFVLVFKIIIKLVAYFFILEEFNYTKIIFKFIFLKIPPSEGRLVGRPYLVCLIENLFKHVHEKGGNHELHIWSSLYFQLVSQLIFFCILICIFYICMLQTLNSINFDWYLYFHAYIWFDCAYNSFTS